jgi:hypothetical protein
MTSIPAKTLEEIKMQVSLRHDFALTLEGVTNDQVSTLCADLKQYFGFRTVTEEQAAEGEPDS